MACKHRGIVTWKHPAPFAAFMLHGQQSVEYPASMSLSGFVSLAGNKEAIHTRYATKQ